MLGTNLSSNIFSTLHSLPTPVAQACGAALPYSGISRLDSTVGTADRVVLIATNTGNSANVILRITLGGSPGYGMSYIPVLGAADDAGGPTSGRAMKLALEMVNSTPLLNMGGRVTVLNARQRLLLPAAPSVMTTAQWNSVLVDVRTHPDARSYGGCDFQLPKIFTAHPVDDAYNEFDEWRGTTSVDLYADHWAVWPSSLPQKRKMSAIIAVFEAAPSSQDYTITTHASFYTRWGLNTVPGQTQTPVPTAPLTVINDHLAHIENTGSDAVPVPRARQYRGKNSTYGGGAGR